MLGNLGFRAARWQWREYQKSRKQPGGPWTGLAVVFMVAPLALVWPFADLIVGDPVPPVAWVLPVIVAVLLTLGVLASASAQSATVAKYERKDARRNAGVSPGLLREQADRLDELEASLSAGPSLEPPEPEPEPEDEDAAERERIVQSLFSVTCPEESCQEPATVPCVMGIAVPVALVRKQPLAFCHVTRMRAAVEAGTASAGDIVAQFGNNVPGGLL